MYTEHKPYEPAFYATVVQDWGSSLMLANRLGEKAACLVDLGHHLPNANIEQIVARLITAGKLGGFHFNDSKYGDDDLTTGSIQPYQLFLIFNELVDAEASDDVDGFDPDYMIDQSHNLKDPIEAFLQTVDTLQRAYAQALLVDREALRHYQQENDVVRAEDTLKQAYRTDVSALVAEARRRQGGALDPIATFRASGYRRAAHEQRSEGAYTPPQSL
jgi:L-rhamnose isomerase/sugar isomerase